MDNVSESKKGVVIFGQQFCDKLEHIPIKKRISLRDSALYHQNPSSAEVTDQKVSSHSLRQHSDPTFFPKKQPDNLKPGQLDDYRSEIVVLNNVKADYPPVFSCIETHIDSTLRDRITTVDNANKVPSIEALSPCTESKLPSMSSFVKDDGLGTKSAKHVKGLRSDMTGDSYFEYKSTIQLEPPIKDHIAVQSVTQNVRILWDLNVEMDAWEKHNDHQNVESLSNITTSDCMPNTKLDISEDFRLKEEAMMSEDNTKSDTQSTYISASTGGICKCKNVIPDSTDFVVCEYVKEDQQVAVGTCPHRTFSGKEPSLDIVSKTDEHLSSILGESVSKLSADAPKKELGISFEATNYFAESTEEQNFENKNIVIEGESSYNILQFCDGGNGSAKKRSNTKAGQLEVIVMNSSNQCVDLLAQAEEVDHSVTLSEKIIGETAKAAPLTHHPTEELTKNSPEHVDVSMENQKLGSFLEGCDTSIVEPLCVPGKCNQDATVFEQVPNIDTDPGAQTEQDYEDGELRDLDTHCWNGIETEMGETECLDYEPVAENLDNLDESSTSVSVVGKGEDELKKEKCRSLESLMKDQLVRKDDANSDEKVIRGLCSKRYFGTHISNKQLERKLSGWDQLPKDDHTSLDKMQETHRISTRTSRSELQSFIDISTLSEDAEEKETVLERRIRPKDMGGDSYPAESGSGFDKFSGKRQSAPHMRGRNRVEDWDSERRSSVNYHDLYDNHSGSRRIFMNSKGREHLRSRSPPPGRSEAYDAHINYSRYSGGRYARHAKGSGRSLRGARNGYRESLTDDRGESEFCVRQQFISRDRSFSPRAIPHFSGTFNRSRSRSRTRSPPVWLPPYERMGSRGQRRSLEFREEDRVKRTRLPFWKSNFTSDNEMRCTSPSRGGFIAHNKPRWNDNDDFDIGGPRDRSPVRSFHHKEKFNATCSRGRFKPSEDFRPMGYRGRIREIESPNGVRGYIGGNDRRKHDDSFEIDHRKRFYKDGFSRQYRHDAEDDNASQNFPLKENFLEDGETRVGNIHKNESSSHERYEYDQLSYLGSTPNAKR